MERFTWTEEYSTGSENIDDQHKKLFDIMNDLIEAIEAKKTKEVLDGIIDELSKYTFYHFSAEEDYMKSMGYSQLDEHKSQHKELIEQLSDIFNRIYEGQIESTGELYRLLKTWLMDHILDKDMQYKAFGESQSA